MSVILNQHRTNAHLTPSINDPIVKTYAAEEISTPLQQHSTSSLPYPSVEGITSARFFKASHELLPQINLPRWGIIAATCLYLPVDIKDDAPIKSLALPAKLLDSHSFITRLSFFRRLPVFKRLLVICSKEEDMKSAWGPLLKSSSSSFFFFATWHLE